MRTKYPVSKRRKYITLIESRDVGRDKHPRVILVLFPQPYHLFQFIFFNLREIINFSSVFIQIKQFPFSLSKWRWNEQCFPFTLSNSLLSKQFPPGKRCLSVDPGLLSLEIFDPALTTDGDHGATLEFAGRRHHSSKSEDSWIDVHDCSEFVRNLTCGKCGGVSHDGWTTNATLSDVTLVHSGRCSGSLGPSWTIPAPRIWRPDVLVRVVVVLLDRSLERGADDRQRL